MPLSIIIRKHNITMKAKILSALLILFSLFGYLEWGKENHSFLFEAEYEVFSKLFTDTQSVIHPFTLIPLIGQISLMITLFQRSPHKRMIYAGIVCIGLLIGLMFFIGIISKNFKILISTIPFIATAIYTLRYLNKQNKTSDIDK
ncbi:MAG: hypothetical protein BWX95_02234 [Bacteroidetes bacterium ADurb.Bin141]|nr:MAG: hypothetical protein UZ10_BCD003000051 [Bacteroidetes bacterium OLB10]OQB60556.1 MAG: hypothetical protein BWX95_02234 [Bacteroidetes bacterium ADurb.Bin141]